MITLIFGDIFGTPGIAVMIPCVLLSTYHCVNSVYFARIRRPSRKLDYGLYQPFPRQVFNPWIKASRQPTGEQLDLEETGLLSSLAAQHRTRAELDTTVTAPGIEDLNNAHHESGEIIGGSTLLHGPHFHPTVHFFASTRPRAGK